MTSTLQLLWHGPSLPDLGDDPYGPFALRRCDSLDAVAQAMREGPVDALMLHLDGPGAAQALCRWPALSHAVLDAAVLVSGPAIDADLALRLIDLGVQDVCPEAAANGRAIRLAVQRKRLERAARKAYATDLGTGLPNHAQLLEHMSHLLALREREPAPMALLVLRVEGLSATSLALGSEAAQVLRRKLAVRLRAGLRASDVVAALGNDAFAVLLAWIDAPADAKRVADKLVLALQQPFKVAGQPQAVSVALGLSRYPEHGRQADDLLRRALGQAGAAAAGDSRTTAANDE